MDVSVIRCSQVLPGMSDLGSRHVRVCAITNSSQVRSSSTKSSNLCLGQTFTRPSRNSARLSVKASSEALVADKVCGASRSRHMDGLKIYVGMPVDAVSESCTVKHARAIAVGLKALKLLGVDGVELPIWWGVAEKEAMGKYDWTGYLAVAEMIHKLGLKLHVSFCFHASSSEPKISLPDWVCRIGQSDPAIFYADRSGRQYKDCLSLAVDDLPVLDGKTPLQVYQAFCESFKTAFSKFMGSTITGISIGLGPDGELRYPSHHDHHKASKSRKKIIGAGEFQCYDKNMLSHLKHHAEEMGNPLWGLGGPHDAPSYEELPSSSGFFKDQGGSWESAYGNFFLSWYSKQLITHGDQLLSVAASTFRDSPIMVSGKLPLLHHWFKTRSHPAELTAGIFNTVNRDGYEEMIKVFSRNSCRVILPGIDMADCDENQPNESLSSPESLLEQIISCCRKHGVEIMGMNSDDTSFQQMKKSLVQNEGAISLLTYQRMGAYFFSPEHFPSFTKFIRNLRELELDEDDQPGKEEDQAVGAGFLSGRELHEVAA